MPPRMGRPQTPPSNFNSKPPSQGDQTKVPNNLAVNNQNNQPTTRATNVANNELFVPEFSEPAEAETDLLNV